MTSWEAIIDWLDAKGYEKENIDAFLIFIDAIDNPIEFQRVLDNLLQIIPCLINIHDQYTGFDLNIPLSYWHHICLKLKSDSAMQRLLLATRKPGKMPLRGYYDTKPVYVAVWQRPGSLSCQHTYFQLLAHCLIAVTILRKRMIKQKKQGVAKQELDNYNINDALLAVRNLTIPENLNILESLSALNVSPKELLGILEKSDVGLVPLKVLLKYLLSIRRPPHRQEHSYPHFPGLPRKTHPPTDLPAFVTEISSNLDSEQEEGSPTFDLFQLPSVEESKAMEIEHVGCSPAEGCSGVEIVSQRMNKADSKLIKSPDQKGLQKRKIKNQLAMLNQRLTTRWEVLSIYEVSVFLTAIADLIDKKDRSVYLPDDTTYGELAALLTTMFWFGQRLDMIVKFRVYDQIPCNNIDTEPGFVITEQNGYWWAKPALPIRKKLPDDIQQEQAYPTVSNFALFSGIGLEKIICSYISKCHLDRSNRLFYKDVQVYEALVSSFISSVNSRHSTRLTANRISDYLFEVIASQDGADLTTAMFIIGKEHFLGRNPSYYTSMPVTKLQNNYATVCRYIRDQYFSEKPRDNQKHVDDVLVGGCCETNQNVHVGSPFRPTHETIANLVAELQASLEKSAQTDPDVSKLIQLHNSFTRYTVFMIAFSTGFRAIRDPFLSAAEIDWDSGFAVLSDKDNEDSYNSRLICLPPVCLQQLKFFREHQQNALYRFNILIPDIFSMPDRPRRDLPGRYMFFAEETENSGEYESLTLRPALVGRGLQSVYALPFNSSRHYLRSCLLERQCPIEVINAFMGHFERGEEPWGVFSGLSPFVYRDALMDKLIPLLKDDGWKAIPGLKVQL